MPQRKLEQLLLHANVLDTADLAAAAAEAARTQTRLAWHLLSTGAIKERQLAQILAEASDCEIVWTLPPDLPPWIYRRLPAPIARQYKAVPLDMVDGKLRVAVLDPTHADMLEVLTSATSLPIVPVVAPRSELERLLEHVYPFDVDIDATRMSQWSTGDESEPGLRTIGTQIPAGRAAADDTLPAKQSSVEQIEKQLDHISVLLDDARRQLAALKKSRSQ